MTGTRADWGLLSPVARALDARDEVELQIVATNMHLDARYGHTIDEIAADGLRVDARVDMQLGDTDDEPARVHAMARCLDGMADALTALQPDAVLILGDRYEMLAVASAALMMRIPIIHIAGGETSEGAVDNAIRHAITQMASLHLVAAEPFRAKVIAMGADPEAVVTTGAIGVDNIMRLKPMSLDELNRSLGWQMGERDTLLVTYHPATLDEADPAERFGELLTALDRFPDHKILITYPNSDARGAAIIDRIEAYAALRPGRVLAIPSLGRVRYLSALRYVAAVVGNSSSGLVEVPSMGIPTVNIGMRQQGRLAGESVIHCGDSTDEITAAIARALSPEGQAAAAASPNPYHRAGTLDTMVERIMNFKFK